MSTNRAGVFVGVDSVAGLPTLSGAAAAAARMHTWALSQGMRDGTQARLITDAGGASVNARMIADAIEGVVRGEAVQQLILYFAGCGVNINRGEHWLLGDAADNPGAAVNVSGSAALARYCGIPHVVIVSDTCRVAPSDFREHTVGAVNVFPHDAAVDRANAVDQFYACTLGSAATEYHDADSAASAYSALYTDALLDALNGAAPTAFETTGDEEDGFRYVRPRGLQRYLEMEVAQRVTTLGLQRSGSQTPDAIITSDASWLARVEGGAGGAPAAQSVHTNGMRRANRAPHEAPPDLRTLAQRMVSAAIAGDFERVSDLLLQADHVERGAGFGATVHLLGTPFGPDAVTTDSAIRVRGATLVDAQAAVGTTVRMKHAGVDVHKLQGHAASVVLAFEEGFGCVIPAIPGFVSALTFDEGALLDVAFEPVAGSHRSKAFDHRAAEIRPLRVIAAASSRVGLFRPPREDALDLELIMQYGKGVDPAVAAYAAYAYHDLHDLDRIRAMSFQMRNDIGSTLFDLALLGRQLDSRSIGPDDHVVPFVPLLSQGWALLGAHQVSLHPALRDIERSVRDSVWTLFDMGGVEKLKGALKSGDVR